MRTIRHSIDHIVPLVGIGLILAGLFGGPALPAASAAEVDPFTDQHDGEYQNSSGWQDSREQSTPEGYRRDQLALRELGYGLPDRYTIHKGQTCELRCERTRSSREYKCREYRC
jgi:hypothetical protein